LNARRTAVARPQKEGGSGGRGDARILEKTPLNGAAANGRLWGDAIMAKSADRLYQAMKTAAKGRKVKASPQHDLYRMGGPYFFHAFYFWRNEAAADGKVEIGIDISVKYWRYDELQYSITDPESSFRFTDKTRANSVVMCRAELPRIERPFSWDGSDGTLLELCESILDWITAYQMNFVETAEREYGGLDGFYIAHEAEYPLLAGLTYVERGLYADAERCFRSPKMSYAGLKFTVVPETEEQKRRLERYGYSRESGFCYRDMKSVFIDYAVAKQRGLDWNRDLRNFGLP